jgi:hypothetical protein
VLTGYVVAPASLILLGGALDDRYGRRKVFVLLDWLELEHTRYDAKFDKLARMRYEAAMMIPVNPANQV